MFCAIEQASGIDEIFQEQIKHVVNQMRGRKLSGVYLRLRTLNKGCLFPKEPSDRDSLLVLINNLHLEL